MAPEPHTCPACHQPISVGALVVAMQSHDLFGECTGQVPLVTTLLHQACFDPDDPSSADLWAAPIVGRYRGAVAGEARWN